MRWHADCTGWELSAVHRGSDLTHFLTVSPNLIFRGALVMSCVSRSWRIALAAAVVAGAFHAPEVRAQTLVNL